jgi:DNA-binding GntR family transcriptional regulator
MFEAPPEFEALCAKLGAVRMTMLEKKQLEVVNLKREQRSLDGTEDLAALNNEFHEIIYHGAHNASIESVTRSRKELAPFRAPQLVRGQTEYAFCEHDKIAEPLDD